MESKAQTTYPAIATNRLSEERREGGLEGEKQADQWQEIPEESKTDRWEKTTKLERKGNGTQAWVLRTI